ncbi:C2 calcium-dependent domain-containing protein 4C [Perca fluviatilis]|uniref:C2 calcium-dependent domain-containing protein 4C n=1 Tax=Perca fluviatilis TaxID=8168 RepID=UPI00196330BC|nr:C2 calcium-dependent domain-containing protein 4C [Perca fluviatilis]
MWVFGKIRESMESIPLELSRYMGKSEEDIFLSSKASLSRNLHINILTPDKIPEFCLPPRLCKRSPLLEAKTMAPYLDHQNQMPESSTSSNTTHVKTKDVKTKNSDASMAWKATKKPLPFSAEGYGLAGIYESPNTRRKESLFHSVGPVYMYDRSSTAAPRLAKVTNLPNKTFISLSGFLPLFSSKNISKTGSTGSETPSSSDSSPLSSPYSAKSSLYFPSGDGHLKGAISCPSLIDSRENRGRWKRGLLSLTNSPSSPPSLEGSSLTLAPPVLFPLDVLQCQERLQHEQILPLPGHGKVRLFAEHITFSTNTFPSLSTVRVRVVSVEGQWDDTDRRTLNCAVNLCLTPGKLQQQESSTIRNCRNPVFNEDFFFTELRREDLQELKLRLKVVDKPAAGTLRRGTVIGVITKPLSQLLPLKKTVEE